MATITEDYVSYEIAKLLKEKGFDEGCSFVVNAISKGVMPVSWPTTNSEIEDEKASLIALPTLQMATKWLRKVHNLHIMVDCIGAENYIPTIQFTRNSKDIEIKSKISKIGGNGFDSNEQAIDVAIKYCLENLI